MRGGWRMAALTADSDAAPPACARGGCESEALPVRCHSTRVLTHRLRVQLSCVTLSRQRSFHTSPGVGACGFGSESHSLRIDPPQDDEVASVAESTRHGTRAKSPPTPRKPSGRMARHNISSAETLHT